jgi:acyl-CoA thioester hydrolase
MTAKLTAPILSSAMTIDEAWVDYNGHLNQAYYSVLFDRAIDEALIPAGLGPDYVTHRNASYMTVENHICFVRELLKTDRIRVASRVLDVDDKRLHLFCEMQHAADGWLSCTSEWMFLHVDMQARRTAPWPADVRARLEAMKEAALSLPRPDRAGRRIGIERKATASTR